MIWVEENNKLIAKVHFKNTEDALNFIKKVALLADTSNHHPLIEFQYLYVRLSLQTHDAGNIITKKDHDLAKKITLLI